MLRPNDNAVAAPSCRGARSWKDTATQRRGYSAAALMRWLRTQTNHQTVNVIMPKPSLPGCLTLALVLSLSLLAADLPAQEPEMRPPPIPDVIPPLPPDPDTLPPPPQLEWAPLGPKDEAGPSSAPGSFDVPAPQPEASIAPPPLPVAEPLVSGPPDPTEEEAAKPDVEMWRPESEMPQIPARRPTQLDPAS
jgi:hypothetical protein